MEETYTITLGDQAENHKGMQKIGELSEHGFNKSDLITAKLWFRNEGIKTKLWNLGDDAYILVAKNGLSVITDPDDFFNEQKALKKDTQAFMYGRVVNKKARHNLCFDKKAQEPDYAEGKGTIIPFKQVPLLKKTIKTLEEIMNTNNLKAEGNYYYDINKCGIGYHGDSERKKVIGIRVGAKMKLRFLWFNNGEVISYPMDFRLCHGDIYIMSEKATGNDWKKRSIDTLRHSAGCDKFIKVPN